MNYATSDPITTAAGTFRIQLHTDEDATSPRDWDNLGRIVIDHRDVVSPDHHPDHDHDVREVAARVNEGMVSLRAACRYLRLALGARVVLPVQVHPDWRSSYSAGSPTDEGMRVDGFTFDASADETAEMTDAEIESVLRAELDTYSRWACGEFVGFVIERLDDPYGDTDPDDDNATWLETPDGDLWGIDSEDYAIQAAREQIDSYRPADFPPPALAAQV